MRSLAQAMIETLELEGRARCRERGDARLENEWLAVLCFVKQDVLAMMDRASSEPLSRRHHP